MTQEEKLYGSGEALKYLAEQMAERPKLKEKNWTGATSGYMWLRVHRENGNLRHRVEYMGTTRKFLYTKADLDRLLSIMESEDFGAGKPRADFSMLTPEEKKTMTAAQIAERAGVGIKTVHLARMRGDLPRGKRGPRPKKGN